MTKGVPRNVLVTYRDRKTPHVGYLELRKLGLRKHRAFKTFKLKNLSSQVGAIAGHIQPSVCAYKFYQTYFLNFPETWTTIRNHQVDEHSTSKKINCKNRQILLSKKTTPHVVCMPPIPPLFRCLFNYKIDELVELKV